MKTDFKWLIALINESIILEISYQDKDGNLIKDNYFSSSVLTTTMDKISVTAANILDITDLLMLGIIRFRSSRMEHIVDIPLRKLARLFEIANPIYEDGIVDTSVNPSEVEAFSDLDNYIIKPLIKQNPDSNLIKVYQIAAEFGSLDMASKFTALSEVNTINYQMLNNK